MEQNKEDISQIIFDRQMRIEKWNQNKLAQEVILFLNLLLYFSNKSGSVMFGDWWIGFCCCIKFITFGSEKNHNG